MHPHGDGQEDGGPSSGSCVDACQHRLCWVFRLPLLDYSNMPACRVCLLEINRRPALCSMSATLDEVCAPPWRPELPGTATYSLAGVRAISSSADHLAAGNTLTHAKKQSLIVLRARAADGVCVCVSNSKGRVSHWRQRGKGWVLANGCARGRALGEGEVDVGHWQLWCCTVPAL